MANDFLGGLGGLVKGLSGLMPQDDPDVKILNSTTEVSDLKKQQEEIYAEIGRCAIEKYGLDQFGDLGSKLNLIQSNLTAAEEKLFASKAEKDAKEKARLENEAGRRCSNCDFLNEEGTKFCQECGCKLGVASKLFCTGCGAEYSAGTRFCGECGARISE